jgi:Spy/CpxP family protein refolding chaperone
MPNRRSLLTACALLSATLFMSAPVSAQSGPPSQGGRGGLGPSAERRGPPSVDERVTRMTADLGLSAEQAAKVRAALTAEQRGMDSVLARRANTQDAERLAVITMRTNTEKAISATLTPEQKLRHDAIRARRGGPDGDHRGRRDDRRGPPPDDRGGPDRDQRDHRDDRRGPPPDDRRGPPSDAALPN